MGKGDKKTKKGKLHIGTYGNLRKRKANITNAEPVAEPVKAKVKKAK
jgi:ribosomal small subunit protein bTHX